MRLTGYVVIELKTGKFQPEYAGKLNFYVALVDDVLRRDHHNETIGILICGSKKRPQRPVQLGSFRFTHGRRRLHLRQSPPAEQQTLPNEGHIVAALEWAEPDGNA
ncbi:PDDEXK nuclease domain-containing protein [Pseudarthrobacter sp. 1C304]|uniref:PDDEXK nuclease domain-containing protein n=1 Tax=Pseudarthrobacter sp. 1C304 TaxID=3457438 RepID=UPI003FD1560E